MPATATPQTLSSPPISSRPLPPSNRKPKTNNFMVTATFVVIAGLLAVGAGRMFAGPKPAATVQVVSAAKDIPAGCRIGFGDLHYVQMPKKYFQSSMYNSYESLVGKYTRTYIPQREPITNLTVMKSSNGLATELPKEHRAITLKLTPDALVDSQVRPGDRVDVVATTDYKGKKYTKTICQNVLVMLSTPKEAMLSESLRSQENNRVTLAAKSSDAELLSQASETSKLRLTLRTMGDFSRVALLGSDERDLLPHEALRQEPPMAAVSGLVQAPPLLPPPSQTTVDAAISTIEAAAAQPIKWVVEMFSGSRRENHELEVRK